VARRSKVKQVHPERHHPERLGTHTDEVLAALQNAEGPMSAYALLEVLRSDRIQAPTTIYRALARLMAAGVVHRLESLNAYIACRHQTHGAGAPVLVICNTCGRVDELSERDIVRRLEAEAARTGFRVDTATIELKGRCAAC
jgi:Fur family zinc uptake transcriptional regulator